MLCSALVVFISYFKFRSEKPDVMKAMLHRFEAEYGFTFYVLLVAVALNAFIAKMSFTVMNETTDCQRFETTRHL